LGAARYGIAKLNTGREVMTIPLYQEHQAPKVPPEGGHLGLWYTRFFNRYTDQWTLDDTAKQKWVNDIANRQCGNEKTLDQHVLRLLKLIKALKGQFAICESNWHFATGLGLPHPVENGFTWHQTLGVPFLAGSAIKGVLRAWVEFWDETDRAQRLKDWFGEQDEAGKLIFFDAIPVAPVRLMADIMTPHYGKWYEKGEEIQGYDMSSVLGHPERLPADWHDPVPVPFLVAKQAKFLVGVAARDARAEAMVATALESLVAALQWLGAGAKTAAGYGHLLRDERAEKDLLVRQQKQDEEKKRRDDEQKVVEKLSSDLEKQLYKELFSEPNESVAVAKATEWFKKLDKRDENEALQIAGMLKDFYVKIDKWKGKKVARTQKLKVERIKQLLGES
jgi:CRISPR-associated protein Cmr6